MRVMVFQTQKQSHCEITICSTTTLQENIMTSQVLNHGVCIQKRNEEDSEEETYEEEEEEEEEKQ